MKVDYVSPYSLEESVRRLEAYNQRHRTFIPGVTTDWQPTRGQTVEFTLDQRVGTGGGSLGFAQGILSEEISGTTHVHANIQTDLSSRVGVAIVWVLAATYLIIGVLNGYAGSLCGAGLAVLFIPLGYWLYYELITNKLANLLRDIFPP